MLIGSATCFWKQREAFFSFLSFFFFLLTERNVKIVLHDLTRNSKLSRYITSNCVLPKKRKIFLHEQRKKEQKKKEQGKNKERRTRVFFIFKEKLVRYFVS